jgi:hypothetical protein
MHPSRKMHLVAYLKAGPSASYPSTWRHPAATLDDLQRRALFRTAYAGSTLRENLRNPG